MNSTGRIHSMDVLRASAMLLLVPAHAAGILAANGDSAAWVVALSWSIHVFRTPLFFAMSGFFLAFVFDRQGLQTTARKRTVRVLVPLAVGVVSLVPLLLTVSAATDTVIATSGRVDHTDLFQPQPSYLWFLWYLAIVDGIAALTYLLAPELLKRVGRAMNRAIARPLVGIALLAAATGLTLWSQPNWIAPPGSENFAPDPAMLVYYALFFGLGVTLCVHRKLVSTVTESAWRWAACAVAAAVPAAMLYTLHNSTVYGGEPAVHAAALLIYAIATWTSVIALIGLANRYIHRPLPAFRYLADSSYWIYLSHLIPMVLLFAALGSVGMGNLPRFALVTLGSLAVSLLTYALFVRYTPIGWVLNGPRQRPGRPRPRMARRALVQTPG